MKVAKYRCPEGHGDFNLEDPVAHDRWDTTCGHLLLALFDPWAGIAD